MDKDNFSELARILENAPCGVAVIDGDGSYIRTNRVYQSLTGYTRKELESRSWLDVTHPLDVPLCKEQMAALAEASKSQSSADAPAEVEFSKRYLTKTGKIIWAKVTIVVAGDDRLVKYTEPEGNGGTPSLLPSGTLLGWAMDNWRGIGAVVVTIAGSLWGQYRMIVSSVEKATSDAAQARAIAERLERLERPQPILKGQPRP